MGPLRLSFCSSPLRRNHGGEYSMRKKSATILLLSSIAALTIGCSTSPKKVDNKPEQWLSFGGWSINVVSDPSSVIPLQYDLLCRNPSKNAQVTSILLQESQ